MSPSAMATSYQRAVATMLPKTVSRRAPTSQNGVAELKSGHSWPASNDGSHQINKKNRATLRATRKTTLSTRRVVCLSVKPGLADV